MATRIPTASRNAACNGIVDLLDGGSAEGYVEIRTGSQPATANDAASGTLLATITLNDSAFGAASTGTATADVVSAPLTAPAVATSTAGWFRGYDSNDAAVIDGSATATGGGGDMQLNTVSLVNAVDVTITAWTITMPAS